MDMMNSDSDTFGVIPGLLVLPVVDFFPSTDQVDHCVDQEEHSDRFPICDDNNGLPTDGDVDT